MNLLDVVAVTAGGRPSISPRLLREERSSDPSAPCRLRRFSSATSATCADYLGRRSRRCTPPSGLVESHRQAGTREARARSQCLSRTECSRGRGIDEVAFQALPEKREADGDRDRHPVRVGEREVSACAREDGDSLPAQEDSRGAEQQATLRSICLSSNTRAETAGSRVKLLSQRGKLPNASDATREI